MRLSLLKYRVKKYGHPSSGGAGANCTDQMTDSLKSESSSEAWVVAPPLSHVIRRHFVWFGNDNNTGSLELSTGIYAYGYRDCRWFWQTASWKPEQQVFKYLVSSRQLTTRSSTTLGPYDIVAKVGTHFVL